MVMEFFQEIAENYDGFQLVRVGASVVAEGAGPGLGAGLSWVVTPLQEVLPESLNFCEAVLASAEGGGAAVLRFLCELCLHFCPLFHANTNPSPTASSSASSSFTLKLDRAFPLSLSTGRAGGGARIQALVRGSVEAGLGEGAGRTAEETLWAALVCLEHMR